MGSERYFVRSLSLGTVMGLAVSHLHASSTMRRLREAPVDPLADVRRAPASDLRFDTRQPGFSLTCHFRPGAPGATPTAPAAVVL